MSAPTPRDPRAPRIDAEEVTAEFSRVLSESAGTLREELDQLTRAHDILHRALQRG